MSEKFCTTCGRSSKNFCGGTTTTGEWMCTDCMFKVLKKISPKYKAVLDSLADAVAILDLMDKSLGGITEGLIKLTKKRLNDLEGK